MTPNEGTRFAAKVAEGPPPDWNPSLGPCLIWTAGRNNRGYPQFFWNGRKGLAHRFAYERAHGPIAAGLEVDHLCRVKMCVRLGHLEAVSASENQRRNPVFVGNTNSSKTHCPQGHPYAGDNVYGTAGHRQCRACRKVQFSYAYRHRVEVSA